MIIIIKIEMKIIRIIKIHQVDYVQMEKLFKKINMNFLYNLNLLIKEQLLHAIMKFYINIMMKNFQKKFIFGKFTKFNFQLSFYYWTWSGTDKFLMH